jgi:hypothetical protein
MAKTYAFIKVCRICGTTYYKREISQDHFADLATNPELVVKYDADSTVGVMSLCPEHLNEDTVNDIRNELAKTTTVVKEDSKSFTTNHEKTMSNNTTKPLTVTLAPDETAMLDSIQRVLSFKLGFAPTIEQVITHCLYYTKAAQANSPMSPMLGYPLHSNMNPPMFNQPHQVPMPFVPLQPQPNHPMFDQVKPPDQHTYFNPRFMSPGEFPHMRNPGYVGPTHPLNSTFCNPKDYPDQSAQSQPTQPTTSPESTFTPFPPKEPSATERTYSEFLNKQD